MLKGLIVGSHVPIAHTRDPETVVHGKRQRELISDLQVNGAGCQGATATSGKWRGKKPTGVVSTLWVAELAAQPA